MLQSQQSVSYEEEHRLNVRTLLEKCRQYVKSNKMHVPDPLKAFDNNKFTPQVKCSGSDMWYQLPDNQGALIIAYWNQNKNVYQFNVKGIKL